MTGTGSIFPLGHFVGAAQESENSAPVYTVRIGWDLYDLASPVHLELWILAHGEPGHDWSKPWDRQTIVERYGDPSRRRESFVNLDHTPLETDRARIERFFDGLLEASVLVEIDPVAEPERADTFLRRHRFMQQLIGLGEQLDTPGMEQIGLRDEPMLQVTKTLADTWRSAPRFADLARARDVGVSPVRIDAGGTNARQLLSDLRVFLVHGAGYLDRSMAYADEVQEEHEPSDRPASAAMPDARAGAASPPGVWAVPPDLASGRKLSPKAFSENLYRARVTGQDLPFDYVVTHPSTGAGVPFHSIADGVLVYTIYREKWSTNYVRTARTQVEAAAGNSIEWLVRDAKSADSIRSKLQKADITEIAVTHRPYPHG